MQRKSLFLFAVICLVSLLGCGGGSAPEAKSEPKKEVPKAAEPPAAGGGIIAGKATFTGTPPVMKPVSMDATPACARQHSSAPTSEDVIVGSGGTLKNVFVWVKAGLPEGKTWAAPKDPVLIDQAGCVYKPHVVGVMVDQELKFTNSDPTGHNVHPLPEKNREWNQSQAPQGEPIVKAFSKEEVMVPIKCNLHPWMRVYVGVISHPFFAVTGDDGSFSLKGLPPGSYTVEAWHERLGRKEAQIQVSANQSAPLTFAFSGDGQ
ncbi:MAG: carboxypeptidase regulatory-like domain-containing protein [Bryobacteraceae bacterium]